MSDECKKHCTERDSNTLQRGAAIHYKGAAIHVTRDHNTLQHTTQCTGSRVTLNIVCYIKDQTITSKITPVISQLCYTLQQRLHNHSYISNVLSTRLGKVQPSNHLWLKQTNLPKVQYSTVPNLLGEPLLL